jgi:hypothetical protein
MESFSPGAPDRAPSPAVFKSDLTLIRDARFTRELRIDSNHSRGTCRSVYADPLYYQPDTARKKPRDAGTFSQVLPL